MAKNIQGQVRIPRIEQVDARLGKPLDKDAPPSIYQTTLKPEYATAALNLSVDFVKQEQSLANKVLLFHPLVISMILILLIIVSVPNLTFPHGFISVTRWVYHLFLLNKSQVFTIVISSVMTISLIFTILSRIVDSTYKNQINQIVSNNGESIFNIKLNELAKKNGDKKEKKKNDEKILSNTNIIVYRNTPIALISLSESHILSNETSIVVTINSLGCRKVYLQSGILEDLIDWAMIRTQQLNPKGKTCKLIIEVSSVNKFLQNTLMAKGFKCFSRQRLESNRLLGGLFGFKMELWGVQFHVEGSGPGKKQAPKE